MSYCVNCGVELDATAKKCALCGTPVLNPNALKQPSEAQQPFSDRIVIPQGTRRRYAAFITSMVILIPNIVCLLINLVFDFDYLWATYLNSISALFWLLVVFPFLLKKPKSYILVPLDALGVFLFTYVFYRVEHGAGWLRGLALPIIVVSAVFVFSLCEWIKHKKLDWPLIVSAILTQVSITTLAIELIIRAYYSFSSFPLVSIIVTICCLALGIFFLAVFKNKRLRAWLSRKFFI